MLDYIKGADLTIDIEWTDSDDVAIVPTSISFVVKDRDGTQVWARTPSTLIIEIADNEAISTGNYSYVYSAVANGVTTILSAGLLRVRNP